MEEFGLLGKSLKHSYSPRIHELLGRYTYNLFERQEDEVGAFIGSGQWQGLNVTIPYKKTVMPYLTGISDAAKEVGSVNTIYKAGGEMHGENTDVYGFTEMVRKSGIDISGKKTLVLGSGGASCAVMKGLKDLGADPIIISRTGENNYENIGRHEDARIIVNTTPLGMYPKVGAKALDLTAFRQLDAVYDLIYNPARTALVLQAEELGIPAFSGLYMLVAQAMKSAELFTGETVPPEETERIYRTLLNEMINIVLIGTTEGNINAVAKELGRRLNREVAATDAIIEEETGKKPYEIIRESGEEELRRIESEIIARTGMESGKVIVTGETAILCKENYEALHQNGTTFKIGSAGADRRMLTDYSVKAGDLSETVTEIISLAYSV